MAKSNLSKSAVKPQKPYPDPRSRRIRHAPGARKSAASCTTSARSPSPTRHVNDSTPNGRSFKTVGPLRRSMRARRLVERLSEDADCHANCAPADDTAACDLRPLGTWRQLHAKWNSGMTVGRANTGRRNLGLRKPPIRRHLGDLIFLMSFRDWNSLEESRG
jgi:hypothetical protein